MMTITPGVVTLTIPAAPEHVRFARLLAGGLASQCDFDIDAVEDVRIAIDECCHALLGQGPAVGTITISCSGGPDGLRIEGWADAELSAIATPNYEDLSEAILDAVVDHHELLARDGRVGFIFEKRRRHG